MINEPIILTSDCFQPAWLGVVKRLAGFQWEVRNLIEQIRDPGIIDQGFHNRISTFAQTVGLLSPKHVAYTIFPHKLYQSKGNAAYPFQCLQQGRRAL